MRFLHQSIAAVAVAFTCLSTAALAAGEQWSTDFKASQSQAASEGKDLLMDFTGSDWCPPCQALKKNVFSNEAFLEQAPDHFVLVELDFPNNVPQSDEVRAQNAELAEKYQIESFPTVILADAEGRPYASMSGYGGQDAEAYLENLGQLREKKTQRDEALAKANDADDDEAKARALHAAMQAVGLDVAVIHYPDTVDQIMRLDADGSLGLKQDYEQLAQQAELEAAMGQAMQQLQSGQVEAGLTSLNQVLDQNPPADMEQMIRAIMGQAHAQLGDTEQAIASLKSSIEVDPDSQIVPQIRQLLQTLEAGSE
jgi:thioredoxin-related protein